MMEILFKYDVIRQKDVLLFKLSSFIKEFKY